MRPTGYLQNRGWVFFYGRAQNFKTEGCGPGGMGAVPGDLGEDWGGDEGRTWERGCPLVPEVQVFAPGEFGALRGQLLRESW